MTGLRRTLRSYPRPMRIPVAAQPAVAVPVPVRVLGMLTDAQAGELVNDIMDIVEYSDFDVNKLRRAFGFLFAAYSASGRMYQHGGAQSQRWTAAYLAARQPETVTLVDGSMLFLRTGELQPALFALPEVA